MRGVVSFLCGWRERTGAGTVMARLGVPADVARIIVELLIGFVPVYEGGTWKTIGWGVEMNGDVVTWIGVHTGTSGKCGSSVGGRIAWLEPSLQQVAGPCGRVYWAFDLLKHTRGACQVLFYTSTNPHVELSGSVLLLIPLQEGVGACSSLPELDLQSSFDNSGRHGVFYPVTCDALHQLAQVVSFGVSISQFSTKVNGMTQRKCNEFSESEQVSFLLEFTPDKKRGRVTVFRNLMHIATFDNVDTSLPIFPTVNMCCREAQYLFAQFITLGVLVSQCRKRSPLTTLPLQPPLGPASQWQIPDSPRIMATTGPQRTPPIRVEGATTAQSQMVSLMLAAHPRCGAHTALPRGPSPVDAGGLWLAFLRALWSDYIAATEARFVVDLTALSSSPASPGSRTHDCGVQLRVSPAVLGLTGPVTTHAVCHSLRLDGDRHLDEEWGGCTYELRVVDATTSGTNKGGDRDYYVVHNDSSGSYYGNSRWVVMFSFASGEGTSVSITKAVDLPALKFVRCRVDPPFPCFVKCVSFCVRSDPDKAVFVLTHKPNKKCLSALVVDVAKSFESRSLVIVSDTQCVITGDGHLGVSNLLCLSTASGSRCFVLRKTYDWKSFQLSAVYDAVPQQGEQPVATEVKPGDLGLSQLSESQFCVCTKRHPSAFAEVWDCSSGVRPEKVRVIRFGGPKMATMEANSGFLFVCSPDRIKAIEASTGVCFLTLMLTVPCVQHITRL
ncbi:hypothetical protein Pelo_1688 [Pelomyxa schiedti]|nr:hypothetical protein Pelo_1688 [Pelomyxa schiedti]